MIMPYPEIGDQKNSSLPTHPATGFQDLPFETRSKIYNYVIPHETVICSMAPTFIEESPARKRILLALEVKRSDAKNNGSKEENESSEKTPYTDHDSSNPGNDISKPQETSQKRNNNTIFFLSKQISDEALNVLYGENIFRLHLHEEGLELMKENFTAGNRARMRYLLIVAAPWMARSAPDETLFASIMPNLKVLRIVARQPVRTIPHGKPPGYTFEGELARWQKWIRAMMEGVGQYFRDGTLVEVDIDGREGTGKVIGECLQCEIREVECRLEGDRVHRGRGKISGEERHGEARILMR